MVADMHLAALSASASVDLCGVLGRRAATTEGYAQKAATVLGHPVKAYDGLGELLKDANVDFAIIATPPYARAEIIDQLAAGGVPMLVEKPVERTFEAARILVETAEKAQVPMGVVLQHRARKASVSLRQVISEDRLGRIVSAEIRIPWWREQSYYDSPGRGTYSRDGGGVMITQGIHALDLALWLLGPIDFVQALMCTTPLHKMEAEDWAGAVFKTTAGVAGTITATTAAYPGEAESITLYGSKNSACLSAGQLTVGGRVESTIPDGAANSSGGGADPMAFTHEWHQRIIEDFADCISNGNAPIASGRSALVAQAVIDAMTRSNATGQRIKVPASCL
jgi:predicted dehydrogenase